jgi:hypothetical protein
MNRWQRLLDALEERGYTMYKISLIVGVRWDTVQAWRNGSEPKFTPGEKLLELAKESGVRETVTQ